MYMAFSFNEKSHILQSMKTNQEAPPWSQLLSATSRMQALYTDEVEEGWWALGLGACIKRVKLVEALLFVNCAHPNLQKRAGGEKCRGELGR